MDFRPQLSSIFDYFMVLTGGFDGDISLNAYAQLVEDRRSCACDKVARWPANFVAVGSVATDEAQCGQLADVHA